MEIYKSKCSVSSFHRDCKAHKSDYSISKYRLTINCMRNYTCTCSPYSQLSLTLRSSMFPEMDKVGNCILEGPLAIRCAPSNSANIGDKMSSLSTPGSFHLPTSLTLDWCKGINTGTQVHRLTGTQVYIQVLSGNPSRFVYRGLYRYTGTQAYRYTSIQGHGTYVHMYRYTGTQVYRYTGTQVYRYIHRYTDTQAHGHTGTQAHRYTGTRAHRHTGTQSPWTAAKQTTQTLTYVFVNKTTLLWRLTWQQSSSPCTPACYPEPLGPCPGQLLHRRM